MAIQLYFYMPFHGAFATVPCLSQGDFFSNLNLGNCWKGLKKGTGVVLASRLVSALGFGVVSWTTARKRLSQCLTHIALKPLRVRCAGLV